VSKKRDPITLEVMRNVFQSVAEEMGAALIRTALSTNIKDRRDCSSGIYTATGELVAQAEHIPLHLGLMPTAVKSVLKHFPPEKLQPGDAIMVNDPFICGAHLPDICVFAPVFHKGRIVAIVGNLAHHVDVGGMSPGSCPAKATEIFQEGIRIPPIKLRTGGKLNEDVINLVKYNVRTAHEFEGDLQAQLAGCNVGERRLRDITEKYGYDHIISYMEGLMEYSNKRMRKALESIPDGRWTFEDYLENDGQAENSIAIRCSITFKGDEAVVDFTGSSPQVAGAINCTRAVTLACVYYTFKAVCDPEIPSNEGAFWPIKVITPEGSILNPGFPAAVSNANANTSQRVADAVLGVFAQIVPKRVQAAGTGSMNALIIGGINPRTNEYYSFLECYGGGQGAMYNQDGMDGVHTNMTNTRNAPVEVIETEYPLRVRSYRLAPLTGGEGEFRGGAGLLRELEILDHNAQVTISFERLKNKPWGLYGGQPGTNSECVLISPRGEKEKTSSKHAAIVGAGYTIAFMTAGGGGYGSPLNRDPKNVQADVLEHFISAEQAKSAYKVLIDKETKEVDEDGTKTERGKVAVKKD